MTAVPLNVDRNPFMREITPQNQYAPTYLELVTRASCDSLPMNWDILVDWGALGLLEELEDLSTDPSLPGAEYLKYCLEQYYFLLIGLTQVSYFFRLGCQESTVKSPKNPNF